MLVQEVGRQTVGDVFAPLTSSSSGMQGAHGTFPDRNTTTISALPVVSLFIGSQSLYPAMVLAHILGMPWIYHLSLAC
jgi:hypothetical protein